MYDSQANEIIANDLLEDIDYEEFEDKANELVMNGNIYQAGTLDEEAPYFVAWYEKGKANGKVIIDRSEAFQ